MSTSDYRPCNGRLLTSKVRMDVTGQHRHRVFYSMHVLRYRHMMRDVQFGLGLADIRALPHAMIIDPRMGLGPRVNRTTTWEPAIVDRITAYPGYFYLVDDQWILLTMVISYGILFFVLSHIDAKERRKRIHAPLLHKLDLPDLLGEAEDAEGKNGISIMAEWFD